MENNKLPERTSSSHSKQNSDSYINHNLPNLPDGAALGTPPTPLNESIDESFVTSHTFPTDISNLSNAETAHPSSNGDEELPGGVRGAPFPDEVVPTTFDDNIYNSLCELECGIPLLLERIKQSMISCKEASTFLKKKAQIEEEYGRQMLRLAKSTSEMYSTTEGKAGSFVESWHHMMRLHESIGEGKLRLATRLNEISDELTQLHKEVDKSRKQAKDYGSRHEKLLQEAEVNTEKSKHRFDTVAEELERVLIIKEGESLKEGSISRAANANAGSSQSSVYADKKGGFSKMRKGAGFFRGRNPGQILKQEEDIRNRISQASDSFKRNAQESSNLRSEYWDIYMPRIVRTLKECSDEIDLGVQYHLERYAFLLENALLNEGVTVTPLAKEDGPGLRSLVERIDNQKDFKTFMQNFAVAQPKSTGPTRYGPEYENQGKAFSPSHSYARIPSASHSQNQTPKASITSLPPLPAKKTFGIDLTDQMIRDDVEIPTVVEKCSQIIEAQGLKSQGIYRLSGTTSKVQSLKAKIDQDVDGIDLFQEEEAMDINVVASVVKQWFRELPEPLLTFSLYAQFVEAAKVENDRLRHIKLHETVNQLPDCNYSTLKYLMGHLDKVKEKYEVNSMHTSNLAIVFGPTLLNPPPEEQAKGTALADMQYQCKAIETILENYVAIFVEEEQ
ncbi:RhoGAP-domain-containing protein [Wallemia mellicola]|uniref:RhoGAP-domain-containing protein n=1 Tax=Wallemia mellicola TaxID=1708541 RepID=A0A4T0TXK3_9BASI|nr:RhoGAP-domain-containing protein [Wallemia mellicola]